MERVKGKYTLVEDGKSDDSYDLGEESLSDVGECAQGRWRLWVSYNRLVTVSVWIVQIGMLAASLTLFILSGRATRPAGRVEKMLETSTFSPALEAVGDFSETITFNGTFDFPSIYRGYPDQSVDAAWKRITKVGPFSVTKSDVEKLGKSPVECAQLPEELGGGCMGTVEVFHQLHCLNMIRKYTYIDYYLPRNPKYWGDPLMRTHIDHCIEMLRQVLMCSSDLGIITYNFVSFRAEAWPDFNTVHQCRDFEKVMDWYHDRELHTTKTGGNTHITKTAGAFVVATPP